MLVIIAPNYFNPKSNGHVVSLNIWKRFIFEFGSENILILSGDESIDTVNYYRDKLGPTYKTESEIENNRGILGHSYSLLLPDDLEGCKSNIVEILKNSSKCRRIYIIIYAPLLVFSQGHDAELFDSIDQRYRFIFFADWIMPPELRAAGVLDIYQEPNFSLDLINAISRISFSKKQDLNISIYAGKGIYSLNSHNKQMFSKIIDSAKNRNCKIKLITRGVPSSKSELYDLLAISDLLICLDPFSNIEREALALGCRVWKPNPGQIGSIPGIYYGNLTNFQLNEILQPDVSCRKRISETYRDYSSLLKKSSETKIKTLMRAMRHDLCVSSPASSDCKPRDLFNDKLIIKMTPRLQSQLLDLKYKYSRCIHPMNRVPELNSRLQIQSALRLLKGLTKNAVEREYLSALNGP